MAHPFVLVTKKMSKSCFLLVAVCLLSFSQCVLRVEGEQNHSEELFLKHLPDGRVFAHFEFVTTWDVHPLRFVQPSNGIKWLLIGGSLAQHNINYINIVELGGFTVTVISVYNIAD